jgi:hypothetical protein
MLPDIDGTNARTVLWAWVSEQGSWAEQSVPDPFTETCRVVVAAEAPGAMASSEAAVIPATAMATTKDFGRFENRGVAMRHLLIETGAAYATDAAAVLARY